MDELERYLVGSLQDEPGSEARELRRRAAERFPDRVVTRKDVNARLYRGLSSGLFRRSDDERPRWYVDSAPRRSADQVVEGGSGLLGRTLDELSRELGLEPPGGGKLAFRKVGERIAEVSGAPVDSRTLRVVRMSDGSRLREDVQVGSVRFADLVATGFERSDARRSLASVRFVVFAEAEERGRSVLLADVAWSPTSQQFEAMAADYEAARYAIACSDTDALPRGEQVRFLRYGTKAVNSADVDALPDGSLVTRRGFYLVKRALTPVLRSLIDPEAAATPDRGGRRPAREGPYEALLFGVLEEQLGGS